MLNLFASGLGVLCHCEGDRCNGLWPHNQRPRQANIELAIITTQPQDEVEFTQHQPKACYPTPKSSESDKTEPEPLEAFTSRSELPAHHTARSDNITPAYPAVLNLHDMDVDDPGSFC